MSYIMALAGFILMGVVFPIWVVYQDGKKIDSEKKERDKWQELGVALGVFIFMITENDKELASLQEKLEMRYLLLMEADRMLFANFQLQRDSIFDRMIGVVLAGGAKTGSALMSALKEYNTRVPVYMTCKELVRDGATVGTRAFALSHFLQKARGKTTGRYVIDVITGRRELQREDLNEFLDFFESITLAMNVGYYVIGIKNVINEFKKL